MADIDKIHDILEAHVDLTKTPGRLKCICPHDVPQSLQQWVDHVARLIVAAVSDTSPEATTAMDRMQTQLDELRERMDAACIRRNHGDKP